MNFDFKDSPPVDEVGVLERVTRFNSRSIKSGAKLAGLKLALGMIDLTTLEGKDTEGKVAQLCTKALHPADEFPGLPPVAAVCVYPNFVKAAKRYLTGSNVKVASVATAFPSGNAPLQVKLADTRFAVESGADEIDMVLSRGEFLCGNYNFVFDEIAAVKEAGGQARLKVILETGELSTLDHVRRASDLAIAAGADFIKTSTGKIQPASTPPVALVMMEAVKDHFLKSGMMIGVKVAGGISTSKNALQYLVMLNETLGKEWMTSRFFRFGASGLVTDLVLQIGKELNGAYFSKDYISID